MNTNEWKFPKNPVSAAIQEKSDAQAVDKTKPLDKTTKAKLSKGMEQLIDEVGKTAQLYGEDCGLARASTGKDRASLVVIGKSQEAYIKAKNDLRKKVAYLQEENRRMKREMDRSGLRFDIYPIKL